MTKGLKFTILVMPVDPRAVQNIRFRDGEMPEVAILVLNWNNYKDTAECLESLQNVDYTNYHIYVIDNGSTDGSGRKLAKEFNSDKYTFIFNDENFGYAGGNNRGITRAIRDGTDYILLLNNDTVVTSDFLYVLVTTAEDDSSVGIIGPKILNYDSHDIESTGFRQSTAFPFYKRSGDEHSKWSCDYVHGCAVLIDEAVIQDIGKLDEDYFLYVEERDLYFRAIEAGYEIIMNPAAVVYHKGMGSSSGGISRLSAYWKVRNLFRCWNKNTSHAYSPFFILYMVAFSIFHLELYRTYKESGVLSSVIKAWLAACTPMNYDDEFKPN